ncbi:unnamed protein product [Diabrotica balteata]|uniref:Uncharacterized protein n=1 Tax=Diabrotica balteata TaxID=107213 RepID=A0A9N9T7B6_DIABA|nr:unnamed protein product [Diabrotica balteata]
MSYDLYDIKEEDLNEIPSEITTISGFASNDEIPEDLELIGIIAEEDTCVGFLLGGIGQLNKYDEPNYYIYTDQIEFIELENIFLNFLERRDISILLIQKEAAEKIRHTILVHQRSKYMPVVVEIPGKNGPYDISIDFLLDIFDCHEKEKDVKLSERRQSLTDKRVHWDHDESSEHVKGSHSSDNHRSSSTSSVSGHYAKDFFNE